MWSLHTLTTHTHIHTHIRRQYKLQILLLWLAGHAHLAEPEYRYTKHDMGKRSIIQKILFNGVWDKVNYRAIQKAWVKVQKLHVHVQTLLANNPSVTLIVSRLLRSLAEYMHYSNYIIPTHIYVLVENTLNKDEIYLVIHSCSWLCKISLLMSNIVNNQ